MIKMSDKSIAVDTKKNLNEVIKKIKKLNFLKNYPILYLLNSLKKLYLKFVSF